jgi:hypothetical protein
MGRSAAVERAWWLRAMCSCLLISAVLAGCGRDDSAPASSESAVVDAGKATCRRFTTCVPENPCHTGWVTGCRGNTPICTDIGGWLSNGTSCGDDLVCSSGECVACAGGDACAVKDMYGNPDPCSPGAPCANVEDPCHVAAMTCVNAPACASTGQPVQDGTACAGGVCRDGSCAACGPTAPCPAPTCYAAGQVSCATGACEPASEPLQDGTACGSSGEICVAGVCSATAPALLVRTASGGLMDVTGTSWTECHPNEPVAGMSRRAIDAFGAGTFTHTDVVFTSALDCTGPTDASLGFSVTAPTLSAGDRWVGWEWTPPPGIAPTVMATAVLLYGIDPATGLPPSLKFLWFVNDLAAVQTLHEGAKDVVAPDGYPALLRTEGRARVDVGSCQQDAPCQGPGSVCTTWTIDCSSGVPACMPRGTAADGTSCGVAGETCGSGTCAGIPGAPIVVRAASGGAIDLTGTTWMTCHPGSPEPGNSRWTSDLYGPGTITHREEVYVGSLDCTGTTDPARSFLASATIETTGDRLVGWTNGAPPTPGLGTSVVATGVVISGTDAGTPFSFPDLRFVDDVHASPRVLYQGNGDGPLAADGFPAQLANDQGREAVAPLATYDTLAGATLDGQLWQTPVFTRAVADGKALLHVRADDMQARTLQGVTYTNAVSVASGANRVTTLGADVTVPAAGSARTGTAIVLGGIRLTYQPALNRRMSFPAQNANVLSASVELYDTGSGLRVRRRFFVCNDPACVAYGSDGIASSDPVEFTVSGVNAFAPAAYDTTYTLQLSFDEATNVFSWSVQGGQFAAPVSGSADVSAWAAGVGIAMGTSTNGFASAQIMARATDEVGGSSGSVSAEFGNVIVGLNGAPPSLWDDFATRGSTPATGFSPALWGSAGSEVTLDGGSLRIHADRTSVSGGGGGTSTAVNAMYPAPFHVWQANVAIVADRPAATPGSVNTVLLGGSFYNDGSAGAGAGDATGDVRANVALGTGTASYTVFKCTNALCSPSTWVAGGALTPSGNHPLGVGTVHTLRVQSSPATNLFTFGLDDAPPVQVDVSTLAPAAFPTPRVPVKFIVTTVSIGSGAVAGTSAAIDAAVNDVRYAP